MATFTHDGEEFDLVTGVDDLEVADAEVIERAAGIDLRDIGSASMFKQLQVFLLISLRRKRPDATLDDTRRIKLGPVLAAFTAAGATGDVAAEPKPEADERPEQLALTPTNGASGV